MANAAYRSRIAIRSTEMAIDRRFWEAPLTAETRWLCPRCKIGHVRLTRETLKFAETTGSRLAHADEDWEPEWITYRFVALMTCDKPDCKDPVVVHGMGTVGPDDGGGWEQHFSDMFYPKLVFPSPDLFEIPSRCPKAVAERIRKAFVLSWGEYDACGNQIRIALELVLNEQHVPRFTVAKGKRSLLTLHSRIDKFAALGARKNKHLSDLMKAVKWLGNIGSHAFAESIENLTASDVFDALDLLQYIVDELYGSGMSRLTALARRINRQKGPRRKRGGRTV